MPPAPPASVVVEADGGSRGNPGPAAYGALLRNPETGSVLARTADAIGVASNNVAEYRGLIAGLRLVAEHAPAASVEVRMDSQLVIEQMAGRWRVKHPDLRPLAEQARILAPAGTVWTWVRRERNADADALLNSALDGTPTGAVGDVDAGADAGADQRAEAEATAVPAQPADPATRLVGWDDRTGTPTRFILLRHGVTRHTLDKRFSGTGGDDPGLTDHGHAQAEAAAAVLAARGGVDAIVTSPLRRAQETAQYAAKALDRPVVPDHRFAEAAFGAWDGYTFGEVRSGWPAELDAWLSSTAVSPPGGESFDAVRARVRDGRDALVAEHAGRTVLAVTHVTPIKMLVQLALEAPPQVIYRMELAPASISEIHWYPSGLGSLRTFSVATHLPDAASY